MDNSPRAIRERLITLRLLLEFENVPAIVREPSRAPSVGLRGIKPSRRINPMVAAGRMPRKGRREC